MSQIESNESNEPEISQVSHLVKSKSLLLVLRAINRYEGLR